MINDHNSYINTKKDKNEKQSVIEGEKNKKYISKKMKKFFLYI